jgi:hypothetical protein
MSTAAFSKEALPRSSVFLPREPTAFSFPSLALSAMLFAI